MADDEVKISITADGELAKAGIKGVQIAAEKLTHQLGITGQMSRYFGHTMGDLTAVLGTGASALGVLTLAAVAGVAVWNRYREAQQKAREETIKAGTASGQWIEQALGERGITEELAAAKTRLAQAQFDLNKANMEAALPEMRRKMIELTDEYNRLLAISSGDRAPLFMRTKDGENVFEAATRQAADLRLQINKLAAEIGVLSAQGGMFTEGNREGLGGVAGAEEENRRYREKKEREWQDLMLQADREYLAARRKQAEESGWEAYRNEQKINQMREQGAISMASNLSQTFQLLSQTNTAHARRWFSIYKVAAIGETIMTTARAAMAAFAPPPIGLGPIFGGALAATITALGAAKVALIRSQTFEGGGGGGAVGTYPANPATGLPSGGGQAQPNIYISVNGGGYNLIDITAGVVRTLYNNNGSVGGLSVAVERTA